MNRILLLFALTHNTLAFTTHLARSQSNSLRRTFPSTFSTSITITRTSNMSNSKTNAETDKKGAYKRNDSKHRNIVGQDPEFPPEADRYHLHIALACPWADGVLAMLYIKGLDHVITHR